MSYPISINNATSAYAKAASMAEDARKRAAMYDRMAASMDGVYITCKIADKAAQLFPAYSVRYYRYCSGAKALLLTARDGSTQHYTLDIARKDDKRLTAAALRERAEYERGQAAKYQAALDGFWDYISQYNVLISELNKVRDQIAPVMYCSGSHCF